MNETGDARSAPAAALDRSTGDRNIPVPDLIPSLASVPADIAAIPDVA